MALDVHNHLLCLLYGLAGPRCRLRRLFIYSPRKILGRCMNFPFINLLGELIQPSSISFTFPLASDWFASSLLTRASSLSNFFSRLETEKEIFSSFLSISAICARTQSIFDPRFSVIPKASKISSDKESSSKLLSLKETYLIFFSFGERSSPSDTLETLYPSLRFFVLPDIKLFLPILS